MLTFGDVLAVVALLIGLGAAGWATMVVGSMWFPTRSAVAARAIESRPFLAGVLGLAVLLVLGAGSGVLLSVQNPLAKLLGTFGFASLLAIAALGASGLARLTGERVQTASGAISLYQGTSRGAVLITMAALTPVLGWFLVLPIVFLLSLGVGTQAFLSGRPVNRPWAEAPGP